METLATVSSSSLSSSFNVHNFPLRWGWMGDHCLQQLAIVCHVFTYPQGVHILCQTRFLLFLWHSNWTSTYNPHSLYLIQQTAFYPSYVSKPSRSSTPHISLNSKLDFPSFHFTPALYLNILQSHLCRTLISLSVSAHVSVPQRRADLTQAL